MLQLNGISPQLESRLTELICSRLNQTDKLLHAQIGSHVTGGDIYGTVFENRMVKHKMMLPPKARGTVTWVAEPGHYTVLDKILEVEFDGEKTEYSMLQVSCALTS